MMCPECGQHGGLSKGDGHAAQDEHGQRIIIESWRGYCGHEWITYSKRIIPFGPFTIYHTTILQPEDNNAPYQRPR